MWGKTSKATSVWLYHGSWHWELFCFFEASTYLHYKECYDHFSNVICGVCIHVYYLTSVHWRAFDMLHFTLLNIHCVTLIGQRNQVIKITCLLSPKASATRQGSYFLFYRAFFHAANTNFLNFTKICDCYHA